MTAVRKFKRLLYQFEVLTCLATARLLVRHVHFRRWRSTLGVLGHDPETHETAAWSPAQLDLARATGREVARMARRAPFAAVCLPQAMAARWLLARRGIPSRIVIGSRRNEADRALMLHAWLVVGGEVVTGASEREEFMAFRSRAASPEPPSGGLPRRPCDAGSLR